MKRADLGFASVLKAFRIALEVAAKGRRDRQRTGWLYDMAMVIGRPGLGGFAPAFRLTLRSVGQVPDSLSVGDGPPLLAAGRGRMKTGLLGEAGLSGIREGAELAHERKGRGPGLAGRGDRLAKMTGEGGLVQAIRPRASPDGEVMAGRDRGGTSSRSYHDVMVRAREAAVLQRARREAARAVWRLPPHGAAPLEMSFAPPSGRETAVPRKYYSGVLGWEADEGALTGSARAPEKGTAPGFLRRRATYRQEKMFETAPASAIETRDHLFSKMPEASTARSATFCLEQALDEYFFRKSRLPPAGGAWFNPLLSPIWAGFKIPG